ncbi:hypothetical protein Dda_3655 [Drechslerella dactyloides]|uniref:Uncharacterized protein n=1 Tax=Drechslerella dactyloides TaxID=74499 RepID=A0AAD6IYC2_DREDA|nr:hypothetical protein Dda_3655 [Drechslerella dactyloides]
MSSFKSISVGGYTPEIWIRLVPDVVLAISLIVEGNRSNNDALAVYDERLDEYWVNICSTPLNNGKMYTSVEIILWVHVG